MLAAYGITKRVARTAAGIVAAVAVAGAPVVIDYSRSYSFALPAAAMFTTAVWCQMRSFGHTKLWWSAAWGASLGAMTISRSMTVAFVAGFLVVAVLQAAEATNRKRALCGFGVGVATGLIIAGPWWWYDGASAWQYLTSAGYGAQSSMYGPPRSIFSLASWSQFGYLNVNASIGIPLAAVLLLGAFALGAKTLQRYRTGHLSVEGVLRSEWLCPIVAVAVALGALFSSRNQGSAFIAPLVPSMCAVAVAALFQLVHARRGRVLVVALVVIAAVPTYAMKTIYGGEVNDPPMLSVDVPGWGETTVYDSRSTYDEFVTADMPHSQVNRKAWVNTNYQTANTIWRLQQRALAAMPVTLGFNARLLNVNTLTLYSYALHGALLDAVLLNPVLPQDEVAGYEQQFEADRGSGGEIAILTCDTNEVFPPVLSCVSERAAASAEGLREASTLELPDGSSLQFWVNLEEQRS